MHLLGTSLRKKGAFAAILAKSAERVTQRLTGGGRGASLRRASATILGGVGKTPTEQQAA